MAWFFYHFPRERWFKLNITCVSGRKEVESGVPILRSWDNYNLGRNTKLLWRNVGCGQSKLLLALRIWDLRYHLYKRNQIKTVKSSVRKKTEHKSTIFSRSVRPTAGWHVISCTKFQPNALVIFA